MALSRRKEKNNAPARRQTDAASGKLGGAARPSNSPPPRGPLILAFGVAGAWSLVLAGLVVFSFIAKPVILNREQLLRAEYVVTATIADRNNGTVVVSQEWKQGKKFDALTVENLEEAGGQLNRTYVIPVSRTTGYLYHVTESPPPGETPLIYPATPETIKQLNELLAKLRAADIDAEGTRGK